MPQPKVTPKAPTPKAEETGRKILESALALFREVGFDAATMRDIAEKAQVATGAAYYYYPSKDAIVMEFYRRSCTEMQPRIEAALKPAAGLESRLRELIQVKLVHFAPNRGVLRALLRNGADPAHPLSPFSAETKEIRDIDLAWFPDSGRLRNADSARSGTSPARRPVVLSNGSDLFLGHRRIAAPSTNREVAGVGDQERGHPDSPLRAAVHAPGAQNGVASDRSGERRLGQRVLS